MPNADWNQNDYKPSGFDAIPKGRYLCIMEDSEEKTTHAKTGKYFEFEFSVLKPADYQRRKLWARLNVHNPSDEAQRIGREQYTALCNACGVPGAKQTEQLHNKLVVLLVDIEDSQRGDGKTNVVKGFLAPSSGDQNTPRPTASPAREQQRPAPQPRPQPQGDLADDIPF